MKKLYSLTIIVFLPNKDVVLQTVLDLKRYSRKNFNYSTIKSQYSKFEYAELNLKLLWKKRVGQ